MRDFIDRNIVGNHFLVAVVVVAMALLLWQIHGILTSIFVAYIISSTLSPAVEYLASKKLNYSLAAGIIFLTTIIISALVIIPLVPFFVSQTKTFFTLFPSYLKQVGQIDIASLIQSETDVIGKSAFSITSKIFGSVFSVISTLVISFYFLLNRKDIIKIGVKLFGEKNKIDSKLGSWVRGQLVLSLIIGALTWIGLTLIGIPQALPLAIIAGALEIVPTIGPIVSAIPAMIVAFTVAPALAAAVAILYTVIQQLENHLIVPKVMQQATGMNPVIVIIGVMVGGNLMGVLGALLAIPFLLVAEEIYFTITSSEKS